MRTAMMTMLAGLALLGGPALAQPVTAGGMAPAAPTTTAPPATSEPGLPAAADPAAEKPTPPPLPPAEPVTYAEDDVLGAAESVFGRGAEGLAEVVRKTFKSHGQPNAYIVGREAGAAFIVGLRYGSGTLHHKIEGEMPVHWTGPSIGFDAGGDGSKTFALVYNLDDSEDLYRRYPAAEGKAYLVGGFSVNYLQRDRVIIVPIKLGVGVRLGVNAGYVKFSKKGKIVPF